MGEKLHYNAHYQLTYLRQETPERQLYGPPRRQRQRQLPAAMATASLSKYVASWCYSSHGIINFTYNWRFQLYQNWLKGDDQLCVGGQQTTAFSYQPPEISSWCSPEILFLLTVAYIVFVLISTNSRQRLTGVFVRVSHNLGALCVGGLLDTCSGLMAFLFWD